MKCPDCGGRFYVDNCREVEGGVRRWSKCSSCGAKSSTMEIPIAEYDRLREFNRQVPILRRTIQGFLDALEGL